MTSRFYLFALAALLAVSTGCGDDTGTSASGPASDYEDMDDLDRFAYLAGFQAAQGLKVDSSSFKFFDFDTFREGFDDGAALDSSRLAYITGYRMGNSFGADTTSGINREAFLSGFRSGLDRDSSGIADDEMMRLSSIAQDSMSMRQLRSIARTDTMAASRLREVNTNRAESARFLAEVENREGVVKTESGLMYSVDEVGDGESPQNPTDVAQIVYTGKLADGTVFDSSNGNAVPLGLSNVVPGFSEGIMGMRVGGKRTLYIPPNLGYGVQGGGPIPPNSALVFEVELRDVMTMEEASQALPGQPRR